MAADWIKMRCNLDSDPRVMRMASDMGLPELHVVGLLWKLWSWADAHTTDGNAASVTPALLDRFTIQGFSAQLVKCGWLSVADDGVVLPHFDEHNGQTAKTRAVTRNRVDRFRNASSVTQALPEKRREEKRRVIQTEAQSQPELITEPEPKKAAVAAPASDSEWLKGLAQNSAYNGIDVVREFGKMEVWCAANGKQATRRRFINWLNRAERPMSAPVAAQGAPQRPAAAPNPIAVAMLLKEQIQAKRDEMQRLRFRHACGDYPRDWSWSVNAPAEVKEMHKKLAGEVRELEQRRANIPV